MNHIYTSAFFLLVLVFSIYTTASTVSAQESAGITLVPAVLETAANPGDVLSETLLITNHNTEEKEFFLIKKDIQGVEAGGVPIFSEDTAEVTGFEMSEWITLQEESIVIPAGGTVEIPVRVAVPRDASPGSHFGGVFASVSAPKLREIGAGVGYEVASIISIRISGDIIDKARIRSLSTDKLIYGEKKVQFEAIVENQGNILIRPRGPVTITGTFGKPVTFSVNDALAGVFPGVQRPLTFTWEEDGIGFGRYEAVLALVYDGQGGQKTVDASVSFWILPSNIIIPIISAVAVLFLAGYIFVKLYVRQAVAKATGGRRVRTVRQRRRGGISKLAFVLISLLATAIVFVMVLVLLTV